MHKTPNQKHGWMTTKQYSCTCSSDRKRNCLVERFVLNLSGSHSLRNVGFLVHFFQRKNKIFAKVGRFSGRFLVNMPTQKANFLRCQRITLELASVQILAST
jgi:hypothetical protein